MANIKNHTARDVITYLACGGNTDFFTRKNRHRLGHNRAVIIDPEDDQAKGRRCATFTLHGHPILTARHTPDPGLEQQAKYIVDIDHCGWMSLTTANALRDFGQKVLQIPGFSVSFAKGDFRVFAKQLAEPYEASADQTSVTLWLEGRQL